MPVLLPKKLNPVLRILFAFLALSVATPAAAQSANDFQLPPNPSPTATPRVQGPVDEEAGTVPVRPRAIPTAVPTASPLPVLLEPSPTPTTRQPTGQATPARARAGAAPAGGQVTQQPGGLPAPAPAPIVSEPPILTSPAPASAPPVSASLPAAGDTDPQGEGDIPWLWLVAGLLLGGLAVGAVAVARARRAVRPPVEIERPVVAAPALGPAPPPAEALMLKAEALRVTRSFAFATVDYRLTLINRTSHALNSLEVGADVISAHAQAPVENQLAGPATPIELRHRVERLGPSQSLQLEGQVRLPLGGAQVIFQGKTPLLVPLLRVRVAREGNAEGALTKTFVVGQAAPGGGRVRPFNLDDTPRAYTAVAQRELA